MWCTQYCQHADLQQLQVLFIQSSQAKFELSHPQRRLLLSAEPDEKICCFYIDNCILRGLKISTDT